MTREAGYTGFYHPDSRDIFIDMAGYLDWHGKTVTQTGANGNKFKAGIFFPRHSVVKNSLAGIDALIRELEKNGIIPVPLFSQQKEHAGGCYNTTVRVCVFAPASPPIQIGG